MPHISTPQYSSETSWRSVTGANKKTGGSRPAPSAFVFASYRLRMPAQWIISASSHTQIHALSTQNVASAKCTGLTTPCRSKW